MGRVAGGTKRYMKIVVEGLPSTGKTRFGIDGGTFTIDKNQKLTGNGEIWPDLLIVNAEEGVPAYEYPFAGKFVTEDCKSITGLSALLRKLKDKTYTLDDGTPYLPKTLEIDTWTKFLEIYTNALEQKKGSLEIRDRGKISSEFSAVTNLLLELEMHVILICHTKDQWGKDAKGNQTIVGEAIDAHKKLMRYPDVVLKMQPRSGQQPTKALVVKGRAMNLGEDKDGFIKNPNYRDTFKAIAELWASGGARTLQTEAQAIDEAEKALDEGMTFTGEKETPKIEGHSGAWWKAWANAWIKRAEGLDYDTLKKILANADGHPLAFFTDCLLSEEESDALVIEALPKLFRKNHAPARDELEPPEEEFSLDDFIVTEEE